MHLDVVLRVGGDGVLVTASTHHARVRRRLTCSASCSRSKATRRCSISIGTAICGGSAIAAVASVIKPEGARDVGRARRRVRAERGRPLLFPLDRPRPGAVAARVRSVGGARDPRHVARSSAPACAVWLGRARGRDDHEARARAVDRAGDDRDRRHAPARGPRSDRQVAVVHPRVHRGRRARHLGARDRGIVAPTSRSSASALPRPRAVPDRPVAVPPGARAGRYRARSLSACSCGSWSLRVAACSRCCRHIS